MSTPTSSEETARTDSTETTEPNQDEQVDEASGGGGDPQQVEADFESGVSQRLAELRAKDDPSMAVAAETEEATDADAPGEDTGADTPDDTGEAAADEDSASTLPAAHRRSLLAYGWSDEEIDAHHTTDPERFGAMAARIHRQRNDELARWAELGRSSQPASEESGQDTPAAAPTQVPAAGLKPVDLDALREKYGDDEQIAELATSLNHAVEVINRLTPQVEQSLNRAQQAEQESVERLVNDFFAADDLKPFAQVYGADFASLTDEQYGNRNKVLQTADALIVGAAAQGHTLTVNEALTLAHDMTSADIKAQVIRDDLKVQASARKKSFTVKPNGKAATPRTGKLSESDFEAKVGARLAKFQGQL